MTPPTDPHEIARRLSGAQLAVCKATLFGVISSAFYPGRSHRACRTMVDIGLLAETRDGVGNSMFRWTPLGLAVRSALLASEKEA